MICLLPFVFMIHELEEIIMSHAWLRRNREKICRRFPFLRDKIDFLGSPPFILAVAEEFLIITSATVSALVTGGALFWYCCLLAFSLHLLLHIGQSIAMKSYIPAIATSILCLPYCIACIATAGRQYSLAENVVMGAASLVLCVVNIWLMHKLTPVLWRFISSGKKQK